jgi:hypothetical protein
MVNDVANLMTNRLYAIANFDMNKPCTVTSLTTDKWYTVSNFVTNKPHTPVLVPFFIGKSARDI